MIAGAVCGLAGALLANQGNFVSPRLLDWVQSGSLMIMVILGGIGYLYGGAIGAAVLLALEEVLSAYTITGSSRWAHPARDRAVRAAGARRGVRAAAQRLMALLEIRNLVKRFGGVVATDGVSLEVARGEIHALIGPNGAGKTTLVHQLSGALGRIAAGSCSTARTSPSMPFHERVRLGLARSYQITSIFRQFTVLENIVLAVQARSGSSLSFWRPRARSARSSTRRAGCSRGRARRARDALAGALAHGEQRQLEIGLALATGARLLLLDEPMAGMGPEESERMIALIAGLKGRSRCCSSSTTWTRCSGSPTASRCS